MDIGVRSRIFRNLWIMAQKYLGIAIGFDEKVADIHIPKHDAGTRISKGKPDEFVFQSYRCSPCTLEALVRS